MMKRIFELELGKGFAYEIHVVYDGRVTAGYSYTTTFEGINDYVYNKEPILAFLHEE